MPAWVAAGLEGPVGWVLKLEMEWNDALLDDEAYCLKRLYFSVSLYIGNARQCQ